LDHTRELIVLAFRGTVSKSDGCCLARYGAPVNPEPMMGPASGAHLVNRGEGDIETTVINAFHSDHGPTGYIALDHTRELIVLAFRGTAGCIAKPRCCLARYGAPVNPEPMMGPASGAHLVNYPGYTLSVVGHSLGGGISALAGTVLRTQGFNLDMGPASGAHLVNRGEGDIEICVAVAFGYRSAEC
jgi:hypothetical protein